MGSVGHVDDRVVVPLAVLAGVVAASLSETGHIATVGGTAVIPPVVNYIEGYANGARSVNPDIDVTVAYVSEAADAAAFADPAGGATFTFTLPKHQAKKVA